MAIDAFGPLRITVERQRSVVRGKPATLLALLACFPGETITNSLAVEALWDAAAPPTDEGRALRLVSRRLQAMLPDGTIVTEPTGVRLDPARVVVDVETCATLLDSPLPEHQRAALALWTTEPFAEAHHVPAVRVEIDRLDARRLDVVEQLCTLQLEAGSNYPLVAELERLVTLHPARERMWQLLAMALYGCGRRVEALRAFDRCRAAVGRVSATTSRLEQRVALDQLALDQLARLDLAG